MSDIPLPPRAGETKDHRGPMLILGAVNYDMYPPKMVPGMHVIVHTSATNDKDARLLLMSMGIPFHGKLR